MTRYRDSATGLWVSAATWKRSHAHGGTRYTREIRPKKGDRPFTRKSTPPTARAKASDKREKRKLSTRGSKFAATPSRRTVDRQKKAAKRRKAVSLPAKRKSRRRKGKGRGWTRHAPTPPQETVMHLVTVEGKSHGRRIKRDLLIPAPRTATLAELRAIAERTLSSRERSLAQFIQRGATVAEGPRTKARRAQVR